MKYIRQYVISYEIIVSRFTDIAGSNKSRLNLKHPSFIMCDHLHLAGHSYADAVTAQIFLRRGWLSTGQCGGRISIEFCISNPDGLRWGSADVRG
ncbi:MAG: hypothetical protein QM760_17245 [Nibricoccus sp.]